MEPAADGRGSGDAIGIFDQGYRRLQGTMLSEVSLQGLAARDEAVVGIRKGEHGKKGDRLQATIAESAPDIDPVVALIMGLLPPSSVPDNRIG